MRHRILLFALLCLESFAAPKPTLINGTEVDPDKWKQVVVILTGNAGCTATVVGPRVILTAAHCVTNGATSKFTIDGKTYSARMTRSPQYLTKDHDVALGFTNEDISVKPFSIGGVPTTGQEILLMGYGCTTSGSQGGNDGKLRAGKSTITSVISTRFSSTTAGGALLCPGDSGGPAFIDKAGILSVIGVNSAVGVTPGGSIIGPNHNGRTDGPEHQAFIKKFASDNSVDVCGVTKACSSDPPPPGEPACQLVASPDSITLGQTLSLNLKSQNAVSAEIEGVAVSVPEGQRSLTPTSSGKKVARARVTAASGRTADCDASYTVLPKDNEGLIGCNLVALPRTVNVGEPVTLELMATGMVDFASIDGTPVEIPFGTKVTVPKSKGDYSAVGFVRGKVGSANCYADYRAEAASQPPPDLPLYAVVRTHCGTDQNAAASGIDKVCLGTIKKDPSMPGGFSKAVTVHYKDGVSEVLPIFAIRPVAGQANRDELGLFANGLIAGNAATKLDMRLATISKKTDGTPSEIEGSSKTGKNFKATLILQ